jgi:hypothetical protein
MNPGRSISTLLTACAVLAALVLPPASPAEATSLAVTRFDDPNPPGLCLPSSCSLRGAVLAANASSGADTITLPAGTYTLSIPGKQENNAATGDLDIKYPVTIVGAGVSSTIIQASTTSATNAVDRVFDVQANVSLTMSDLTVRYGQPDMSEQDAEEAGGGIQAALGSTVALSRVALRNNMAGAGGGIYSRGALVIDDSTMSGNTVPVGNSGGGVKSRGTLTMTNSTLNNTYSGWDGGGLSLISGPATLTNVTISDNVTRGGGGGISISAATTLNNVTIAGNYADVDANPSPGTTTLFNGGGIYVWGSTAVAMRNSMLSGNVDNSDSHHLNHPDCSGTITSLGYNLIGSTAGCTIQGKTTGNLIGLDPLLGPLQGNGGPTQTRAIPHSSPAIDHGSPATPGGSDPSACAAKDQRGNPRTSTPCDIGAFEL